jgi:hypothetical protein
VKAIKAISDTANSFKVPFIRIVLFYGSPRFRE